MGNTAPKLVRAARCAICATGANASLALFVVPPAERCCVLIAAKMDAFIVVLVRTRITARTYTGAIAAAIIPADAEFVWMLLGTTFAKNAPMMPMRHAKHVKSRGSDPNSTVARSLCPSPAMGHKPIHSKRAIEEVKLSNKM